MLFTGGEVASRLPRAPPSFPLPPSFLPPWGRRLGAGKRVEAAEAKAFDPWNPNAIDDGMASPYKTVLGAEASFTVEVCDCGGSAEEEAARPGGKGGRNALRQGTVRRLLPARTLEPGSEISLESAIPCALRRGQGAFGSRQCNCLPEVGSRGSPARAWQGAARPRKGRLDPSRAGPATWISCGRPVNRLQPRRPFLPHCIDL